MRGKQWSISQERQLRELVKEGRGTSEISKIMGKTLISVRSKMYHLGLSVVDAAALHPVAASVASIASVASTPNATVNQTSVDPPPSAVIAEAAPVIGSESPTATSLSTDLFTAQLKRDEPLPSIEEKLRVLDAALVALERPGLSTAEISRLNKIIQGVKVYQELFVHFVNYRALETELVELRKQLASEKKQQ